jgi:hypothetical protein
MTAPFGNSSTHIMMARRVPFGCVTALTDSLPFAVESCPGGQVRQCLSEDGGHVWGIPELFAIFAAVAESADWPAYSRGDTSHTPGLHTVRTQRLGAGQDLPWRDARQSRIVRMLYEWGRFRKILEMS